MSESQSGLLVLDMQPALLKVIADAERLLRRVQFTTQAARLLEIPVFFTEQSPEKLGATEPALRAAFPENTVFSKTAFSAFGADGLLETLQEYNIDHLLIAGIEGPICVYQTVLECEQNDVFPTILTDAIGARRPQDWQQALHYLLTQQACAALPTETVFYTMLQDATHPDFRAFNSLVRDHQD